MRTLLVSFAAGAVLLCGAERALACPCLTLVDSQANEVAQRALLVVEPDGLEYVLQLAVEGDASELGWLVPTPAVPDAPVLSDDDLFTGLDELTAPFLTACGGGGGACAVADKLEYQQGNAVQVWSEGKLDNLEYAVLSASDGADLTAWLQTNQYPVASAAQAVIDGYVAAGWAFVALRVSGAALEGDRPTLGPIKIHVPYTGDPVFPVRMSSLSGQERVSLLLYIAAEELMRPADAPLVAIDGDRLEQTGDGGSNYLELVREALDAEGGGFVLEYAGDDPGLGTSDSMIGDALRGKKLVRLHADVAPTALGADLVLEVDTALATPSYQCLPEEGEGGDSACTATGRLAGSWGSLLAVMLALRLVRRRR